MSIIRAYKHLSLKKTAVALPAVLFLVLFSVHKSPAEEGPAGEPVKLRVEFSFVTTSGNTETQTASGKLSLKKEWVVNRLFLEGSLLQAESGDRETANRMAASSRYERVLTERLFGTVEAGYFRDKFSGYDFRVFAGPGAGYDFIRTERHRLKGLVAVLYYYDEFSDDERGFDDYPGARASAKYEWDVLENLKFSQTVDLSVSLEDTERSFIDSVTSAEVKIKGPFSLGVSYIVNYQNEPPAPDIEETDTTLLTSLMIDF
jgi:putative salt-induced outer membrane protein